MGKISLLAAEKIKKRGRNNFYQEKRKYVAFLEGFTENKQKGMSESKRDSHRYLKLAVVVCATFGGTKTSKKATHEE